jgi:diguanylate cyclase (GGDEF)-like protein/PAS domain S-box-containing protein
VHATSLAPKLARNRPPEADVQPIPLPPNEAERLVALAETQLLDSDHEAVFDAIVALAASICGVPMAAISLIDRDRQWFKASVGIDDPETPRDDAFCAHTILEPTPLEVDDATVDARFRDNPFVLGAAHVRFYAGMPLITGGGHALGALCVIDRAPRRLDDTQRASLRHLATVVERLIDARTESLRQQEALRDAEVMARTAQKRLQLIADNIPAAVSIIDRDHVYRFNNAAYVRATGRPLLDITGQHVRDVLGVAAYAQVAPHLERALAGHRTQFELHQDVANGSRFLRGTYQPKRDDEGVVVGVFGMILDQTELKQAEDQLRVMAEFDALTKLANRYRLYDVIALSGARAQRHGVGRALLYLDVDKFKAINDRHGHAGGDAVLVEFARRVKESVRATDTVARLAGDEFVVLLEDVHEVGDAERVAEAILAAMRRPVRYIDTDIAVGTSIGIAFSTDPGEEVDAWLHRADVALYAAKAAGRGSYRVAA